MLFRLSRNIPGYVETVWTIRKISRISRNFPDHLETILTTRKLFQAIQNFPDHPETILTFRKISRLSKKISRLSGNCPKNIRFFAPRLVEISRSRTYLGNSFFCRLDLLKYPKVTKFNVFNKGPPPNKNSTSPGPQM